MRKQVISMLIGMMAGITLFSSQTAVAAGSIAEPTWQAIYIDGTQVEMEAYNINGHNYVKLRDIGKQVGFNVYWSQGVHVDTSTSYTGEAPSAANAFSVSSYKGTTLKAGDRSGLIVSPSGTAYTVTSSDPSVVAVEQVSGNWVAVAKASGTATITATAGGYTVASLTLTVETSAAETTSSNTTVDLTANMDILQEMIQRINQVRRENGVSELTVSDSLMGAAQACAEKLYTYHHNQEECETVASYGYPYGFGCNMTVFTGAATADIAQRAVTNWVNSPGHFQTMIDADGDSIGVGVTVDQGRVFCYMIVGKPNTYNPYG